MQMHMPVAERAAQQQPQQQQQQQQHQQQHQLQPPAQAHTADNVTSSGNDTGNDTGTGIVTSVATAFNIAHMRGIHDSPLNVLATATTTNTNGNANTDMTALTDPALNTADDPTRNSTDVSVASKTAESQVLEALTRLRSSSMGPSLSNVPSSAGTPLSASASLNTTLNTNSNSNTITNTNTNTNTATSNITTNANGYPYAGVNGLTPLSMIQMQMQMSSGIPMLPTFNMPINHISNGIQPRSPLPIPSSPSLSHLHSLPHSRQGYYCFGFIAREFHSDDDDSDLDEDDDEDEEDDADGVKWGCMEKFNGLDELISHLRENQCPCRTQYITAIKSQKRDIPDNAFADENDLNLTDAMVSNVMRCQDMAAAEVAKASNGAPSSTSSSSSSASLDKKINISHLVEATMKVEEKPTRGKGSRSNTKSKSKANANAKAKGTVKTSTNSGTNTRTRTKRSETPASASSSAAAAAALSTKKRAPKKTATKATKAAKAVKPASPSASASASASPSSSSTGNGNGASTRSFVCPDPLCGKTFSRKSNLDSHLVTHSTSRPHLCVTCGKAFARLSDRTRHEATTHARTRTFQCRGTKKDGTEWGCGHFYSRADGLRKHFRSNAGRHCLSSFLGLGETVAAAEATATASAVPGDGTSTDTTAPLAPLASTATTSTPTTATPTSTDTLSHQPAERYVELAVENVRALGGW